MQTEDGQKMLHQQSGGEGTAGSGFHSSRRPVDAAMMIKVVLGERWTWRQVDVGEYATQVRRVAEWFAGLDAVSRTFWSHEADGYVYGITGNALYNAAFVTVLSAQRGSSTGNEVHQ